ncbi:phosphoribosylanthranilate isomerase [Ramlibacter sp. Leaf400]|uniref:phosphoribosylanthranilate isomerase n=1 Tax=Ramlibacter sp. Leaf400 TaxID=1736365 RepID=UPI000701E340|nr:phosphoribosylanthranilate isomerase [Ramlibacter sp. Leaf400]KQT08794.1 N-(5'-phosphoribosyl)anthranilate isomerase [Ramlibacter sp. Leaf400]
MSAAQHPMNLRTRIKICGLTREQDVDAAVQAGADAVGFVLYPKSARYVSAQRAAELARRLPPFVSPVLLFVNETPANVAAACELVPHAMLQFHGDETPGQCLAASGNGARPWMRAARIPLDEAQPFDLVKFAALHEHARALLLDAHVEGYGGGGKAFNWSRLPPSVNAHLVLSGGLTPANVTDGIVQVRPRCRTLAVDVSSGVEASAAGGASQPGVKDPEKIHQFVAAVRAADVLLARSPNALLSTT